jgi:hypothetical protein
VAYRPVFGAPLEPDFMAQGWTSHLAVWDRADSPEHHVDLFSRPPRVSAMELASSDLAFASRHVVAQMKKTDRDRDWPIVDSLGLQMRDADPALALRHIQDARLLMDAWRQASPGARSDSAVHRPLLRLLDSVSDPDALHAWLRLERIVWETINQERYGLYTAAWKGFYRRWRASDDFAWPTAERFPVQHRRVREAAALYGLSVDPLGAVSREVLYARALRRAAVRADSTLEKIAQVQPPLAETLP